MLGISVLAASTGGGLGDLFSQLALADSLQALVTAISSQMQSLLPIGVALIGIYAAPRIVKRVISTFL